MTYMCEGRPPVPGDPPCSCGRPARLIYITELFGDVPGCGIADAPPLPERFDNPAWVERWGHLRSPTEGSRPDRPSRSPYVHT